MTEPEMLERINGLLDRVAATMRATVRQRHEKWGPDSAGIPFHTDDDEMSADWGEDAMDLLHKLAGREWYTWEEAWEDEFPEEGD